jgi:hypothetical protein
VMSLRSVSAMSKGSKFSNARTSRYGGSSMGGSKWGKTTNGGPGEYGMRKLEIKPTIQEQMAVTKEWWESLNPNADVFLPLPTVKRHFVRKQLAQDLELAEKIIFRFVGKVEEIEYKEFYKIFCKGIFKIALQDMMANIEKLSQGQQELPLPLKLGAYRRNLMLSGIDKTESALKDRGKSILYALKIFKGELDPTLFENLDFKEFVLDPLGKNKQLTGAIQEANRLKKYDQTVKFRHAKALGPGIGVDTEEIEKTLRGEDDQSIREVLKDLQEEKKGQ